MKDNALYLEADEDITSAIDKLQKLTGDSAQIVVPKRSTILQSVINLKLLKKAADNSGKELVLVTNDRIATDLAARVGLAVAPSLGAKAIHTAAAAPAPQANEDIIEESDPEPPQTAPESVVEALKPKAPAKRPFFARKAVADGPAGGPAELAAGAGLGVAGAIADSPAGDTPASSKPALPKVKVPDFNRLQRRLLWLGLGAFLVVGYFVGMYFLATAKVTLYASGTKIDIDTSFSADPNLKGSDMGKAVLAAQTVTFAKDLSGSFTPTGKKDVGTKASGTITVVNKNNKSYDFVAGTRFMSADGKVFRTNTDVHLDAATVTNVGWPPQAVIVPKKVDVAVTADQNGDSYNQAPGQYSLPGLTPSDQQFVYGEGKQMNGGTSRVITVVTQADIDKAKTDLLAKDKDAMQNDLNGRVPSGYLALAGSQQQSADAVTSSPALDQEAGSATVTVRATYTQLAVPQKDYQELIRIQEQKQIGDANQIYNDGLDTAKLTLGDRDATGRQGFHVSTQAYGGAKLDKSQIAAQLKGKKYGDAAKIATGLPGVQRAEINLWPAWSTNLPGRSDKITITIQVAGVSNTQGK